MDTNAITHVSLCSGYGGIDLGLKRAIGRSLRTVAYVEVESFAVANLVAKASQELLDNAPTWSDLKRFPWGKFHGLVDILSGGYPCQPFSAAGKRLGAEDPRHLWPHISAGIALMRPSLCFFENVEGHISLGLPDVLQDLAGLGYRTTWGIFSASEVGAPHQRKRVFILAYRHGERGQLPDWWREPAEQVPVGYGEAWGDGQWPSRPGEQQFAWEPPRVVVDAKSQRAGRRSELRSEECGSGSALSWDVEQSGEAAVANDHGPHAGHGEQRPERTLGDLSGGCGEAMGNTSSQRCQQDTALRGEQQPSGTSEKCGLGAAEAMEHSNDACRWQEMPERETQGRAAAGWTGEALGNAASEGPQERSSRSHDSPIQAAQCGSGGEGNREAESSLGRDADGPADWLDDAELYTTCDNRTDELRLLGNGVVPACAERAFRVLVGELMEHQA